MNTSLARERTTYNYINTIKAAIRFEGKKLLQVSVFAIMLSLLKLAYSCSSSSATEDGRSRNGELKVSLGVPL